MHEVTYLVIKLWLFNYAYVIIIYVYYDFGITIFSKYFHELNNIFVKLNCFHIPLV